MVRWLILLAVLVPVLVLGLAACGGSGVSKDALTIKVGRTGGLIVPYAITIAPGGAVTTAGNPPAKPVSLSSAQDEELSRLVRAEIGKLKSLQCGKTFPDEASMFITALRKTVVVRGNCEPGFTKLFYKLTNALGLNQ